MRRMQRLRTLTGKGKRVCYGALPPACRKREKLINKDKGAKQDNSACKVAGKIL